MYGIYENGSVIAKFTTPMTVRSNRPVTVSDTLSLRRQTSLQTAQRWEIETGVEPLSFNAQDLFVSLVTKGYSGTVTVLMPQNYGALMARTQKVSSGTASGAARATQVTLSNVQGFIPKGTFVQFGGHSKVYMTVADRAPAQAVVEIYPPLRKTVTAAEFRYCDDVMFKGLYDTNVVKGMVFDNGILMSMGTITIVEDLNA